MTTYLITGGAGFVGSSLAIAFKQSQTNAHVIALDNLKRRGSELNLPRLRQYGVEFVHGDIRQPEDLNFKKIDVLLECSAEPSVLAGFGESPAYVLNTNLVGTLHCLELARRFQATVIFLSTSRVYPIESLNALEFEECPTRFAWKEAQRLPGASRAGIREEFPLQGARSLYGATKLASELILQEYGAMYGLQAIINRCGLLAGPWQMGKTDQGVIALWVAKHVFQQSLAYIGYGGQGRQVRDLLHVQDLFDLIQLQLRHLERCAGQVFNVGGGLEYSLSLCELTELCQQITGKHIPIQSIPETRPADLRLYLSDTTHVQQVTGWKPCRPPAQIVEEIALWVRENQNNLQPILG